jgi:carbon monoxide dehydrogenase subunit G
MPNGFHQAIVDIPINKIWNFVKDMDKWAPLIPGYITHKKQNERQSTWEFYSDIGIMKKKICLMVNITEWIEPKRVSFELKDIHEKFTGDGYFKAEEVSKRSTRITGYLNLSASGAMGKVVNKMLKTSLPKAAEELTAAIAEKLN